jgi:hypothetical protein
MISRKTASRPSPALVVALVALVAALAGTAIADPVASTSAISKKKVKKIAKKQANKAATAAIDAQFPVQEAQIGDGAVTSPKILDGDVGSADLGAGSVTAEKLVPGAVGSSELGAITLRTESFTIEDDANPFEQNEVDCNNNEQAISGSVGLPIAEANEVLVSRSSYDPNGGPAANDTGWIFGISNLDDVTGVGDGDNASLLLGVSVVCLET